MKFDTSAFAKFMFENRFEKWPYNKKISSLIRLKKFGEDQFNRSVYSNRLIIRGVIYAQIIVSKESKDSLRGTKYFCTLDYRARSIQASEWIKSELSKISRTYEDILIEVPAHYKKTLICLSRRKFQVESISTISDVGQSWRKLNRKMLAPNPSFHFSPMTLDDIDICVKIMKKEYTKSPEHGLAIASKSYMLFFKNLLIEEMSSDHSHFVVRDTKGKVRGCFGCFISLKDSFWKSKAGMNFCLDEGAQGKGLLDHMYKALFLEMNKVNVKVYTGSTSHPAILKRAMYLDRKPFAVSFVRDSRCYSLKHFGPFLKI